MSITYDQIVVVSKLSYIRLLSVTLDVGVNDHGKASVKMLVEKDDKTPERFVASDTIVLKNKESDEILFSGLIAQSFIEIGDAYKTVTLEGITGSKLLDYKKRTRTFQGCTLDEILQKVFEPYGTSAYYDGLPTTPVFEIQYNETDYAFIKRLMSSYSKVLTPHIKDSKAKLYIDVKNKDKELTIGTLDFKRFDSGETSTSYADSYFVFESYERLNLGDIIHHQGHSLVVRDVKGTMSDGFFKFTYKASLKDYIRVKPYEHPYFAGAGLEGTVLDVENRQIKVHFDVDETEDIDKAQWLPYGPIGCNGWYTMPNIGSTVMVMFENESPSSGVGIGVKRVGHDDIEDMSNPSNKAFTTKEGSYFKMTPSHIEFSNDYTQLKLGDTYRSN